MLNILLINSLLKYYELILKIEVELIINHVIKINQLILFKNLKIKKIILLLYNMK